MRKMPIPLPTKTAINPHPRCGESYLPAPKPATRTRGTPGALPRAWTWSRVFRGPGEVGRRREVRPHPRETHPAAPVRPLRANTGGFGSTKNRRQWFRHIPALEPGRMSSATAGLYWAGELSRRCVERSGPGVSPRMPSPGPPDLAGWPKATKC